MIFRASIGAKGFVWSPMEVDWLGNGDSIVNVGISLTNVLFLPTSPAI